jgi:quercetin dioxygenase-like cupin family protein
MDYALGNFSVEWKAPREVVRERILRLQDEMLPIQTEMPEAVHHYAKGMYAREFSMPAGMTVVGKKHKHEHLMMVLKGKAVVATEFGTQEVSAGLVHVSQPGAKRVVYAIEDTTFVTVHLNPTDTKDIEQIEAEHIEPEAPETIELAKRCKELQS